jgi:outer membrane protein OmpA-like peptidoglycan-associated protein
MNKNLFYGFLFGGLSFFSNDMKSQDVFGCDYIRKVDVNRALKDEEILYEDSYKKFFDYSDFTEPFEDESKNALEGKVMNIYFPTNKCDLSERDSVDIKRYVLKVLKPYIENSNEKLVSFNVEGFADCRGDNLENYDLSHRRAESVASYLYKVSRNSISPSVKIYTSAFGEMQSEETDDLVELQNNRVVKIILNENPIKHALDVCKGRKILGDQSGSMIPYWDSFRKYEFREIDDVFTYSKFIPPRGMRKEECDTNKYPEMIHTYNINTEIAHGATSYYPAKKILIPSEFISSGDTITTIINGKNDFIGESPDEIIRLANEKKVVLNMIGIELSGNYVGDFIRIADETGGKYYFVKNFNSKTF